MEKLNLEQKLLMYAFSFAQMAGSLNERGICVYSDRNHPARSAGGRLPVGLIYLESDAKTQRVHVAAIDPLTDLAHRVLGGFITRQTQPIVRDYVPPVRPEIIPDFRPGKTRIVPYFNNWERRLMDLCYALFPPFSPFGDVMPPVFKLTEDYRI